MTLDRTVSELSQQVDDLKQIVCELSRLMAEHMENQRIEEGGLEFGDNDFLALEAQKTNQAIAHRLNPICYCPKCNSPYQWQSSPEDKSDGVGCFCPNVSLLTAANSKTGVVKNSYLYLAGKRPIGFLPPEWVNHVNQFREWEKQAEEIQTE